MRFFTKVSLIVAVVLAGCQVPTQDDIENEGRKLAERASAVASTQLDSLRKQTQTIAADATKAQLEAARQKAVELQGQLADLKMEDVKAKLKLDAVQKQLEQIDAAEALAKAKQEVQALNKLDVPTPKEALSRLEQAKERLSKATQAAQKAWAEADKAPTP